MHIAGLYWGILCGTAPAIDYCNLEHASDNTGMVVERTQLVMATVRFTMCGLYVMIRQRTRRSTSVLSCIPI